MKIIKSLFIVAFFMLCSCGKTNYVETQYLTKDIALTIKESYLERINKDKTKVEDVSIKWNLGVFDETIYVSALEYYDETYITPAVMKDYYVGDRYICTMSAAFNIDVYIVDDGSYDIAKAYELEKIDDGHLKTIARNAKVQGLSK